MLDCETLTDLQRYYANEVHPLVERGDENARLSVMLYFVMSECERDLTEYIYGLQQASVLEGTLAIHMYLYLRLKPERRIHDQDILEDVEKLLYRFPNRDVSASSPSTLDDQLLLDMTEKMQEIFPFLRDEVFVFYKTGSIVDSSRRYCMSEARSLFPKEDWSRTLYACMVNSAEGANPREQLWHIARVLGKQFFDTMQVETMMKILRVYEAATPEELLSDISQEFADAVVHAMDPPGATGTGFDDDTCREFIARVNVARR
jgi:hypothetical protein